MKDHLLYSAEKSRDLDLAQGQYKAMNRPSTFFADTVSTANFRRQKQAEEAKKKKDELNFDGNPETPPSTEKDQDSLVSSTCPSCGGTCYRGEGSEESCETCGGTGLVYSAPSSDDKVTCPDCNTMFNVEFEEAE